MFSKLEKPNTQGYLFIIVGIFGFYRKFLPLYDLDIRPWRYNFVKTVPTRKTIQKVGYGTDAEPIDTRGPNFTGKVKVEHHGRTYLGKTRTTSDILN